MKTITIDPITRLEGHGKITIFLDNAGEVENAYLQVPELRGFEQFCIGRPVEELPRILPRICGVCPGAHHMASAKAVDAVYNLEIPRAARLLREVFYHAHIIHSHLAHFYALGGPDFIVGPNAPKSERNILGVISKLGLETGKEVIKNRSYAQRIQAIIGGKATHPVTALPGGMAHAITDEDQKEIIKMTKSLLSFSQFTAETFANIVLANDKYLGLVNGDIYNVETGYLGLVDAENQLTIYDGQLRLKDPSGKEVAKFADTRYAEYIGEHVEPWSYLKFPYRKQMGWKGLVEGPDSSLYQVGPLARCNVSDKMPTPLAQAEFEKMYNTLGEKPIHHILAGHWARIVEMICFSERILEYAEDSEITDPEPRVLPTEEPGHGIGVVEAPRGVLIHEYSSDAKGIVTDCNLIVATTHNNAAINIAIRKAAKGLIHNGQVDDGLLNMCEMAFRAFDPCLACSTHCLPGETPLEIKIVDKKNRVRRITQNLSS
ncbi:MAG: Ni/Fe hydrogenase subunit alpha [Candidatus Ranarchaeia archaeon]